MHRNDSDGISALLGQAAVQQKDGRPGDALQSYDRAILLNPNVALAHCNRGLVLHSLNRFDEALQSYERAIRLKPDCAEVQYNKANLLTTLGRLIEALQSYDRTIALRPDLAEAHNNKGNVLYQLDRPAEALECYDRALELRRDYSRANNNRGSTLTKLGRLDEALQSCNRAIDLEPGFAEAHYNKGNVLKALQRLDEAIQSYDRAIELKSDFAQSWWNKTVCTLLLGRFEEGWRLHERRKNNYGAADSSGQPQPIWTGRESLEGKSLFIRAEQGLGDTIQFCRYAVLAEARGATVILAVQDPLVRLLAGLRPTIRVEGLSSAAPSAFDYHIPLLSMPLAFQTVLNNIPAPLRYLRAEPDAVRSWQQRIGMEGFKIGICWQGAAGGAIDVGRSFAVGHFEGIGRMPGVRLISLQKNAGVEQLLDLPAGMTVETLGDDLDAGPDAFVDTAAVMETLDLVITSDTAVAHLAGALGRSTWVVLKQVPDWRWLLDRSDSPWYPTLRLFRQPQRDDWSSVFAAMEAQIAELIRPVAHPGHVAAPEVPISWGELIDKITILEIKSERIGRAESLANIRKELSALQKTAEPVLTFGGEVSSLKSQLRQTNEQLWEIEDRLRGMEEAGEFGSEFVALARSVYKKNDERAALKALINRRLLSRFAEEKSYTPARPSAN